MKGNFEVSVDQMLLDETLTHKRPYAALVVSTTGLDEKDFDKHSPTRVQLMQYEFDNELKQYSESIKFDHLVAADIEAVNKAIEKVANGDYDAFANAGIDTESYKSQIENPKLSEKVDRDKKVFSQQDFKKAFSFAMQSLLETNTTIITNGYEHTQKYLDKIGCGNELKGLMNGGKVIDQPTLAGEYFKSIGKDEFVRGKMSTLENVRKYITDAPNFVKVLEKDKDAKSDFEKLSKEDFLKTYSNVKERQYNAAAEYYDKMNQKAIAPERIEIISGFVKRYGQDKKILESKELEAIRQGEKDRTEHFSERGKEKYEKASLEGKLKIQEDMGVFDREAVLSGDSDYARLIKAMQGKLDNKGVAVVHIATSGLNNPRGNETGLPLEFHFLAFDIDKEGKEIGTKNRKEINLRVQLPNHAIIKAEKEAERGKFDVFKDAGIDIEEYKSAPIRRKVNEQISGKCNWSQEAFVNAVEMTFKKFTPEDYPLIVMGGGKNGDERAFFQRALRQVCNLPVVDAPYIDFTSAVKDYTYLVSEGKIPENVIFDEKPERMGIRDVADAMGITLTSTIDKVDVLTKAVTVMYNQYLSLEKGLNKKIDRGPAKVAETNQSVSTSATPEVKAVAPKEAPTESVDDFTEITEKDAPTEEEIKAARNVENNVKNVENSEEKESENETYAGEDYEDVMTDDDINAEEREKFFSDPAGYLESHKENVVPEPEMPVKNQEKVETPIAAVRTESGSVDLTNVLNVFIEQSRVQTEQSRIQMMLITELTKSVLKQEETYKELLQQQGELLKTVATAALNPTREERIRPVSVKTKPVQEMVQEKNLIERLDEIKENLDALCNNDVPKKAVDYIREATSAITDGQKILSEITSDKDIGKAS